MHRQRSRGLKLELVLVQVFQSEVDNNLGASFVILGLVTSVPNVVQATWETFTNQTLFLRPNVQSLVYSLRVLADQRAAVEKEYNGTIYMNSGGVKIPVAPAPEYAPVIFVSENINAVLLDLYNYTILQASIIQARDTGNFSLSAPYKSSASLWQMGSFLAHYGEVDPSTLTTVSERRADCVGYVVTVLSVEEVFATVVSRLVYYLACIGCLLVLVKFMN